MSPGFHRRNRLLIGALGVLMSTYVVNASEEVQTNDSFDRYEIVTDAVKRQTVLTGFLLDDPFASVAIVHREDDGERRLRVHSMRDGAWVQDMDTTLPRETLFVDITTIDGSDRLITYEPGLLKWFDPATSTTHELVAVTSSFERPRDDEIPHVDITRDVNGDGLDDLVIPGTDGFLICVQEDGGTFAGPVNVGPAPDMSGILGADGYRYDVWSQSRIHEVDFDLDERVDLAFWSYDHFAVHLQDARGQFAPTSRRFKTNVPIDSDNQYSLAEGDMVGRVLHSLGDLNNDGFADLVVFALEGGRISKKRSSIEVHFGRRGSNGTIEFTREVGTTFHAADRIQVAMSRHDFDGDGLEDVLITSVDRRILTRSMWKSLKGFMGEGIGVHLEFFRNEDGRYAEQPAATRSVGLIGASTHRSPGWVPLDRVLRGATHEHRRTEKGWPRLFNTNLLIGDVTGDGRVDVLIEKTFRGHEVSVGVPGPSLFADRSQNVPHIVPHDDEYSWLVDLNRDGRLDIVLHHPITQRDIHGSPINPPGTENHRIVTLVSR